MLVSVNTAPLNLTCFAGEGVDLNTQEAGAGLAVGFDKFNTRRILGRAWICYGNLGWEIFVSGEGHWQP